MEDMNLDNIFENEFAYQILVAYYSPYEKGASTLLFASRYYIIILPEKAFNTIIRNVNDNTFILHDMGCRNNIKCNY